MFTFYDFLQFVQKAKREKMDSDSKTHLSLEHYFSNSGAGPPRGRSEVRGWGGGGGRGFQCNMDIQ